MYKLFVKRLGDILAASVGLLILSPVFLAAVIGLYFANDGRPFYFQLRPGKKERLFKIVKFKTMNDKKDEHGNLLSDAERITKIGNFIRRTSIDEIPQLINVLKGDMSIVGPRPLLPSYLPLYNERQKLRHKVRPGITGWAQINGRNAISWQKKFEYDVWYVENESILLDIKIVIGTFKKVFVREGISSDGEATAKPFTGNDL